MRRRAVNGREHDDQRRAAIRARFLLLRQHDPTAKETAMIRSALRAKWQQVAPPALQQGKMGYILLWLLGVPIPILFVIFLLRGCT